jgi:hypothetical protein
MAKKTSAWVKHLTATYKEMKKKNKDAKLGDAMKAAKKTYKKPNGTRKTGGGQLDPSFNIPKKGDCVKQGNFGKAMKYESQYSGDNGIRIKVKDPKTDQEHDGGLMTSWQRCNLRGGKKSRRRSNRHRTARKSSRKNRRTRRR